MQEINIGQLYRTRRDCSFYRNFVGTNEGFYYTGNPHNLDENTMIMVIDIVKVNEVRCYCDILNECTGKLYKLLCLNEIVYVKRHSLNLLFEFIQ